jgi:hypothetical protein
MTDKLFTVIGVSKNKGAYKVRFANDIVSRIKILTKAGDQDIQLMELPEGKTKADLATYLKTSELYANPAYREAIDNADAKYNGSATVKVKSAKAKTAAPSLEAIKARAAAKDAVAE